jgi:hypothetical protein
MEARGVKSAADERRVAQCVQVTEHPGPVDKNDVAHRRVPRAQARDMETFASCPAFDRRKMHVARLVRRDDEPRVGQRRPHVGPRSEERSLVGGPRRPGDERRTFGDQRTEERTRSVDARGTFPHLVVPSVAGDGDHAWADPERDEAIGVRFVDGANSVEARVRLAQQGCRQAGTA